MAQRDTAKFLRIMNEANERIAAREAEEAQPQTDLDSERLKRDAERRERLGTLRAREHSSKRPRQAYPVFGHVELSE